MNFEEIKQKIKIDDIDKVDVRAYPRTEIELIDDGWRVGSRNKIIATDWAETQLCNRLGIPKSYWNKCPQHLKQYNANHWLGEIDPAVTWLVRLKKDAIRAFLSSKYTIFDNKDIVDIISDEQILGSKETLIRGIHIDDKMFHLRVVFPNLRKKVDEKNELMCGVDIMNSEVGWHQIVINATLHREICYNVVVMDRTLEQRHIWFSQNKMFTKVAEAVNDAVQNSRDALDKFLALRGIRIERPRDLIKRLAEEMMPDNNTRDTVRLAFEEEPGNSMYEVVNAVTRGATKLMDMEKRLMLEEMAGTMIKDPQWVLDKFSQN